MVGLAVCALSGSALAGPVREGDAVPNFALPTVDGKKAVHLSDYRGKKVILFVWASW